MNNTILEQCMSTFPQTDIWMDSFDREHHAYALSHGCKGITTSPTWVGHMLEDEFEAQRETMSQFIAAHPTLDERALAWQWTLEMGRQRSRCMLSLWEKGNPHQGRFSIQLSVFDYRDADAMLRMAREVHACGPNMQVKVPCTRAGIAVMEEATFEGISVMATLCFSLDQAIAAAEAIERGIARRTDAGLSSETLNPVCAVLLGMQEDWLKSYADAHNIVLDPESFFFAGEAVCKKIYRVYREKGYATRVLVAYYRHHRHWSAFMGGDLIMTIPYKWQKRFEHCDIPIQNNMDTPVPELYLAQLKRLPPFVQATTEGLLSQSDFDSFPPVILTLRYFMEVYERGIQKFRDLLLPKPL